MGTHPSCPAPTPQVTAKVWADSLDEDLAHGVNAADQRSQFLIGKATKLDSGGIRPWSSDPTRRGTLNLATATFNGVALGGDRADGMALFSADFGNWSFHSYVGILSGTNLGAPLTQTIGSAKWVGSWRTGNVYNDLRVSFCEDNVGTHPSCPAPTPQVTAKVWVDSFDEDLAHGVNAADQRSQFLIGKATKLDSGGIRPWSSDPTRRGTLNLATATFNGVALGGDRADGMALFSADFGNWSFHSYVGILSGTNLGAPLTQTIGSAKWVGSWRTGNVYNDLRVSFCEDNVGTHPECPTPTPQVTAKVWADSFDEDLAHGVNAADQRSQFLIGKATKLDSGGIRPWSSDPTRRGTLNLATATFNGVALGGDRADGMALFSADFGNWSFHSYVGILSGTNLGAPLTQTIGSAKWVGSWRTGNVYNDLRVSFCEDNVGTHPSCPAPTPTEVTAKVWADSFDEDLAHGVNAADQRSQFLIGKATKLDSGGIRPWSSDPTRRGTLNLATATFNGVALGGDRADGMALFSADFGNWSFHSYVGILSGTNLGAPLTQTIGSAKWVGSWRTGNVYNDLRVSFCEDKVGTHPSCPAPQVTAKVWADSFDEDLAHGVNAADQRSQFLIGKATKLDSGGIRPWSSDPTRRGTLNLATATFNGVALGGDRADGMALFSADFGNWSFHSYVGILSGTNLGAPLTQTIGSAKWVGSWRTGNVYNDLRVSFCEDNVGTHPSCPAPTPTPGNRQGLGG